jgi:dynactin complex subunit
LIRYIGQVYELGYGYFIGIELDETVGGCGNGTLYGMYYFLCDNGKAIFLRPNKI